MKRSDLAAELGDPGRLHALIERRLAHATPGVELQHAQGEHARKAQHERQEHARLAVLAQLAVDLTAQHQRAGAIDERHRLDVDSISSTKPTNRRFDDAEGHQRGLKRYHSGTWEELPSGE